MTEPAFAKSHPLRHVEDVRICRDEGTCRHMRHDRRMKVSWDDAGRFAEVGDLRRVGSRMEAAQVV
jgi:hypothetical protein